MNCDAKFVLHCSSASRSRIYRQSHCRDDQSVGRWSRFNASTCSRAATKREFRQVEGNSESKMRASLVDLKFPDWIPACDARSRYKIKGMTGGEEAQTRRTRAVATRSRAHERSVTITSRSGPPVEQRSRGFARSSSIRSAWQLRVRYAAAATAGPRSGALTVAPRRQRGRLHRLFAPQGSFACVMATGLYRLAPQGDQHRHAGAVGQIFVAEQLDQVALLEQDADENVRRGHRGE
jgi:hypothetical protein